jgi:hypothetical protein
VSADNYLIGILARESVDTSATSPVWTAQRDLLPIVQGWAHRYLLDMSPSGSFAKGTANSSGTDLDLFISLDPSVPETLQAIYQSLFTELEQRGLQPRRQNVSIGLRLRGVDVDLIPGKRQNWTSTDHSLYRRKAATWTKTNVQTHVAHVLNHGCQLETRLVKLWRRQQGLEFPSFYLELVVIEALVRSSAVYLADRVWAVLRYLAGDFAGARFVDPANTNNIISDDLTRAEKDAIRAAATRALGANNWGEIIV